MHFSDAFAAYAGVIAGLSGLVSAALPASYANEELLFQSDLLGVEFQMAKVNLKKTGMRRTLHKDQSCYYRINTHYYL
jgi:hypothetical protein